MSHSTENSENDLTSGNVAALFALIAHIQGRRRMMQYPDW